MTANRKPDRVLRDIAESAQDLAQVGLIDSRRLSRIDALCFQAPPTYSPQEVARIRTRKARMSQAVFAKLLNVSLSTVQKWEAPGAGKHPRGAAAKLLHLIERNGVGTLM